MQPVPVQKPLIGVTEAAKLAGLSRSRFYRLINQNAIPGAIVKAPGCETLIRRAALLRWLEFEAA